MKKPLAIVMLIVLLSTLFSAHLRVKVNALVCKNVNIVFLRGSGQNYTPEDGHEVNFPSWTKTANGNIVFDPRENDLFRDTEPQSAKYFEGIGDRILKEYPTLTMQFVSLHDFAGKYNENGYRAVPAFGGIDSGFITRNAVDAKFGSSSIISESTYGDYRQSVQDGAQELAGYLADEMTRCPSQYNVVGGYSQGAQVVGDAMALMHSRNQDNLLSRLGHVDMFGDPKFNGFKLNTNILNPLQNHTIYPWVRGSANINEVGALGPREPYVPDIITSQTTSWCDFNDPVCGGFAGLSINHPNTHSTVYSQKGGWIEKSSQETFIDMKQRLSMLAGVADKSANSPVAYWPGIEYPSKLDVMFVMDSTADENLSLVPDPDYLSNNFNYLAQPITPKGEKTDNYYSSIKAGVATYTEFQSGPEIVSFPKVPVSLTEDIFSEFGAFRQGWAQAHFLGNYVGGVDFQDSPYGALKLALDQNWRTDARRVIVMFSNSWGKDVEPGTNLTMKQITAKARAKNVEILPVFTSRTMRANPNNVANVPTANAFYSLLAKQSKGHYAEVTDSISSTLVYDVIMGHVFAPDVVITKAKSYTNPTSKQANTKDMNTKTVVKKGKSVVLSASESSSPTSTVMHYAWDFNGDGIIDYESDEPYVEHTYENTYDGQICVTVTDAMGQSTTGCVDIGVTDNDTDVTDEEPAAIASPEFHTTRMNNDLAITWQPTDGYIILRDSEGAVIVVVDAHTGIFTLRDVPSETFSLIAQLAQGNSESEPVVLNIEAKPVVAADVAPTPAPTETTTIPGTISDSTSTTPLSTNGSNPSNSTTGTNSPVLGASTISSQILNTSKTPQKSDALKVSNSATTPKIDPIVNTKNDQPKSSFSSIIKSGLNKALTEASGVIQDYLAWLIIVLLLLVWLYIKTRKRDEGSYQYDAPKKYPSRKVVVLQT